MDGFRIPVGSWVDAGVDWVRDNLSGLLDLVAVVVRFLVGGLSDVLLAAPIIVVIVVTLIVMVVRGVQGESICDMYPSWTPVRDLPIGCLDEVMGR